MAGQLNGLDSLPRPGAGKHDRALVALEAQTVVLRHVFRGGFASTNVVITALHDSLIGIAATVWPGSIPETPSPSRSTTPTKSHPGVNCTEGVSG